MDTAPSTELHPDAAPGEGQPPAAAEPPPERTAEIRKGKHVLLRVLLAHFNPNCGLCKDGWSTKTKVVNGVNIPQVCGCCVVRFERAEREYNRKTKEVNEAVTNIQVESAPLPHVVEQAERRIKRMTADVEALEAELAGRGEAFTASVVDLERALEENVANAERFLREAETHRFVASNSAADIDGLLKKVAAAKLAVQSATETARVNEEAQAIAAAGAEDLRRERARREEIFERQTSRLRKDLEKARRRLATAKGYTGIGLTDAEREPST